jgi:hypothetical protein
MYKFKVTGPFILTGIDNNDPKYLRLTFSDGETRKLAKGGNWPPEYAVACLAKANDLLEKSVFIKTSQTTRDWKSTEWLCDIQAEHIVEKSREIARQIEPEEKVATNDSIEKNILVSCTSGKTYYANVAPVVSYFTKEDDFLDFSRSFEQGFVSAWTAKNARNTKLPTGVKRVRISGLGALSKRNGFRVVAAEFQNEDTSEAFKFFHILRIDEKLDHEEYLSDKEIKEVTLVRAELEARYPKGVVSWMAA